MNSFHEYVSGNKVAPVLTVFVGGNHEASNILHSLYYGGFVAPNIYFMGFAGVVNFRGKCYTILCKQIPFELTIITMGRLGLRIGGLSGIFKQRDYRMVMMGFHCDRSIAFCFCFSLLLVILACMCVPGSP